MYLLVRGGGRGHQKASSWLSIRNKMNLLCTQHHSSLVQVNAIVPKIITQFSWCLFKMTKKKKKKKKSRIDQQNFSTILKTNKLKIQKCILPKRECFEPILLIIKLRSWNQNEKRQNSL